MYGGLGHGGGHVYRCPRLHLDATHFSAVMRAAAQPSSNTANQQSVSERRRMLEIQLGMYKDTMQQIAFYESQLAALNSERDAIRFRILQLGNRDQHYGVSSSTPLSSAASAQARGVPARPVGRVSRAASDDQAATNQLLQSVLGQFSGQLNGSQVAFRDPTDGSVTFIGIEAISAGPPSSQSSAPTSQPLTVEQIFRACTISRFNDLASPRNTECPITQSVFGPDSMVCRIDACGHIYMRDDIMRWFRNHSTCPTCRHNLSSDNSSDDDREEL